MAKIKISDTAYKAIDEGLDNDGVLAAILEAHPGAKTKEASILWYRNEVRKRDGVPSKRRRTTLGPKKKYVKGEGMDPKLARTLRDNRERKAVELHAKHLRDQEERMKRNPSPNRANAYKRGALIYRKRFGRWPSPKEVRDGGFL